MGFVHPLSASGDPDFSRVVPCQCRRQNLKKEKLIQLQRYSNLGTLSRLTFDNLLPEGRRDSTVPEANFTQALAIARDFADKPKGWLVLVGANGCGKTHLACAIANRSIDLGLPALYIGASDLLDHLRSAFSPDSELTYDELFEQVKNTPLLILDDLTNAATTTWAKNKLEQLLDHRFNACLPTVITTNVAVEEFDDNLGGHLADPELCQVCSLKGKTSLAKQLGNLDLELLKKMTFNNFDYKRLNLLSQERQNLEQSFNLARSFAESPQGWLVFLGTNGCGKTHLAVAIANHLRNEGRSALFVVVPDLLDHLRSAFSPDSRVSYDDLFEKVKKTQVLILDDFGEHAATPWAQEKLYQLINYRYNARLATVVTTCLSLDEIESRISSRMIDPSLSLVFNIVAPDYRGDTKVNREPRPSQRYSRRGRSS